MPARDKEYFADLELSRPAGVRPPWSYSKEAIREWIYETSRALGISPTEFARSANLAASTINRFLRDPDESNLNANTLGALVIAAERLDREYLEGKRERAKQEPEPEKKVVRVPVLGVLSTHLSDKSTDFTKTKYTISVPVRRPFFSRPIGAFEVGDGHGGPEYPEGCIVIMTTMQHEAGDDSAAEPFLAPRAGDHVVAIEGFPRPLPYDASLDDDAALENLTEEAILEKLNKLNKKGPSKSFLRRATVRKIDISPTGQLWLMQFNRAKFAELELPPMDSPLPQRYLMLFKIIGVYREIDA